MNQVQQSTVWGLLDLAADEIARCERILRDQGKLYAIETQAVAIECSLRGRSRRGVAYCVERRIKLNPDYFAAVGEKYRQTIAHEYAHLVVYEMTLQYKLTRVRSHGRQWQYLMRLFGYSTDRVSDYGEAADYVAPARKTRRYQYSGVNCGHVHILSARKHASAQRGQRFLCAAAGCLYKARDQRGVAFDKEVA
jgi:predicted SprT family Zn-dependent metalloprotease